MSARVLVMLAMNPDVMPHVCMRKQSPNLTPMWKSGLPPLLKPKETHPKEWKTSKLQGHSRSNATRRSCSNVQ
jgi:hypothetical protein